MSPPRVFVKPVKNYYILNFGSVENLHCKDSHDIRIYPDTNDNTNVSQVELLQGGSYSWVYGIL